MSNKRSKFTASGVSDPQRPARSGGIVPAPLASSSNEGPAGVLPTSTPVENVLAEVRRQEEGTKGRVDKANLTAKASGGAKGGACKPGPLSSKLKGDFDPESFRVVLVDVLEGMLWTATEPSPEGGTQEAYFRKLADHTARKISDKVSSTLEERLSLRSSLLDNLQAKVEVQRQQLEVQRQQLEVAHEHSDKLWKENGELRVECAGLRDSAQSPASPAVKKRSIGVQVFPTPIAKEKKSIGVQSDLPPMEKEARSVGVQGDPPPTTKSRGSQTPVEEGVGGGGGTWSSDRVAALIDERMRVLRDDIVAEVCGGTGVRRPPARKEDAPPSPSGASGPAPPSQDGMPWSRVLGRRERRRKSEGARPAPRPLQPGCGVPRGGTDGVGGGVGRKPRLPRAPGTAAIVLAPVGGEEVDVEGVADLAMSEIAQTAREPLGITARRTVTGGLLLRIPGDDRSAKADKLAAGIRGILAKRGVTGVRVDRPVKLADVRVTGLVGPATADKVAKALAETGGCGVGEVRVGAIRRAPLGPGSAWARLPVVAAHRVVAAGSVKVGGWLSVGVTPIDSGPMRCYRCFRVGHAGQRCTAEEDRGGRCFRCGEPGHLARACAAPVVRCPLCADLGRRSDHRLGAVTCAPPSPGGVGGGRTRGGNGASAPTPRPTQRGKGSGGEISSTPKGDGGAARTRSSACTEAREGHEEEEDPAVSSVAEVDMEVSPLPQRKQRVGQRGVGAKRPAEEVDPGPSGVGARGTGKKKGGVAWVVAPPIKPRGPGSGGRSSRPSPGPSGAAGSGDA